MSRQTSKRNKRITSELQRKQTEQNRQSPEYIKQHMWRHGKDELERSTAFLTFVRNTKQQGK